MGRNKQVECDICFKTMRSDHLDRHHRNKHSLGHFTSSSTKENNKVCNECDFKTKSEPEMNRHKATEHQPDDYYEKSAFNKLLYEKTWRVRGIIDPMIALTIYYPKIKNTIQQYLNEKGAMKWYIEMKVIMNIVDYTDDGGRFEQNDPCFTSRPIMTSMMVNFDEGYSIARQMIEKNFDEFCANGSVYILDRVDLVSVHIAGYDISPQPSSREQREQEQEEFEETL